MTATTEIQKRATNPLDIMRNWVDSKKVQADLAATFHNKRRSGAFANSILNLVRGSSALQRIAEVNPGSIINACMRAATFDVSIDPALGQAAIVPYGKEAVFQFMYRGIIQLCIRTGQYETIHCNEIYRDELKSYNPITGWVEFYDPANFKLRYSEKRTDADVVGHYFYFKLKSGFEKSDYLSREEAMAHARKYSKAYQQDLQAGKKASPWSTDPIPMGNKTVLLRCLRKYGVMSIEIQDAIITERESFDDAQSASAAYIAADMGSEPVDASFENGRGEKPEDKPKRKAGRPRKSNKTQTEIPKFQYVCHKPGCGVGFDEPKMVGPEKSTPTCPACGSLQVALNPELAPAMQE